MVLLPFLVRSQILPSFGNSRTGTTGFQFLKIAPDARSSALSGSFNALCDDVSAVYWNPAALTQLDSSNYHYQFGHTSYFAGIGLSYAGFAYSKNYIDYWGLSVIGLSSGEMPVTTEFMPFGNGMTFSARDVLIGLSYAKILSANFSFGISAKYVNESIANVITQNGIFDFGFVYHVGLKRNTRFAAGISNFGFNVSPSGKVRVSTLNGTKEYDHFENMAVPGVFRMGIATDLWKKDVHLLSLSSMLSHPTDNNETLAVGFEYSLKKLLFLRSGYEFGQDQKATPSAGLGISLQRFFGGLTFDYSFNNKNVLGNIHRITLGVNIK